MAQDVAAQATAPMTPPRPLGPAGNSPGAWWGLWVLLGLAALALLIQLGQTPPEEQRELRVFHVANNMLATGDYLLPRIYGEPHLTKPPLYFWLAAGAKTLTALPERVAFRLPTTLSALALLGLTFWLCRLLGQGRLALPSALALFCFDEFWANGRVANFDMVLAATALASVCCFYKYFKHGERPLWLALGGACFSLAVLTKATPALNYIILPLFFLLRFEGRAGELRRPRVWGLGWLLPVAPLALWVALMLLHSSEAREIFATQLIQPFGVETEESTALHREDPFYYLYNAFQMLLPATLLLPLWIRRVLRTHFYREQAGGLRWLYWSLLANFLLFSILPQKQQHYLLPALPYMAILLAESVMSLRREEHALGPIKLAGYLGCAALGVFALVWAFYFQAVLGQTGLAVAVGLGLAALAGLVGRLTARARLYPLLMAGAMGWLLHLLALHGSYDVWDTQFKTGEVYRRPDYSAAHWTHVKAEYPFLSKIFKTSKRFLKGDGLDRDGIRDKGPLKPGPGAAPPPRP